MSIYNLRPYIGITPLIGGYNLGPYLITPLWKQLNAIAYWNFGDDSKIVQGDTATDIEGWKDTATTPTAYDLEQTTAANQPTWVQGYSTTGAELVINPEFSGSYLDDWTEGNQATSSVTNGVLTLTNGATNYGDISATIITTEIGKSYLFTVNRLGGTGGGVIHLGDQDGIFTYVSNLSDDSFIFTAINTQLRVTLNVGGNTQGNTYDFSEPSVKLAIPDASKSHALFDGTQWLEGMPTQAGDFTYITSFSLDNAATGIIFGSSSNDVQILANNGLTAIRVRTGMGVSRDIATTLVLGTKYTVAVTRSGNDFIIYLNGLSIGSFTDSGVFLVDWIGSRLSGLERFQGKLYNDTQIFGSALSASEIKAVTAELN